MKSYSDYRQHRRKIADINHSIALLHWDMECKMPEKGASFRAQQISTLSGLAHELSIDAKYGELLMNLRESKTLNDRETRNIELSVEEYEKQQKYSTEFVKTLSQATSEANVAWIKAKNAKDFTQFAPYLEKVVNLKREECQFLEFPDHPYDALLDQYEPGAKTKQLNQLFAGVGKKLLQLLKEIEKAPQLNDRFMYKPYHKDKQWEFSLSILEQMGYDFKAGRQDVSAHPFTTTFAPTDVRITTRISENDFNEAIWSCIHEGGHALYEQGLPEEDYGLPTGSYLSLGIHESQSRLWENNVGRGLAYWKTNFKKAQLLFPENLKNETTDSFYAAMNVVRPSLVRTSADELTYHFHVLIRFEIEKALITGEVEVNDLNKLWNTKYKEYLGVDVPSDDQGILQDVHWSHGSFGYFPTYSLGSFYAAQFYHQAASDIHDLSAKIEAGELNELLKWLRENIHQHGKMYNADDLCKKVTGETLNFDYFFKYASTKYGALYNLN